MTAGRTVARGLLTVLVAAAPAVLLAACGGESRSSERPVGTPENPAVAQPFPGGGEPAARPRSRRETSPTPSFDRVVESQKRRPRKRFSPCNLVTSKQAREILGAAVLQPREAPQGPTCIYRTRSGERFVTLAVQSAAIADLRRHLRRAQRFEVGSRRAYCGTLGQPVLHVALGGGRVLTVAAPCDTARRFAATALSASSAE